MDNLTPDPLSLSAPSILVSLTYSVLSSSATLSTVRRPTAGAILLFAGTTRSISIPAPPSPSGPRPPSSKPPSASTSDPEPSKTKPAYEPIASLSYTAYPALALKSMLSIAQTTKEKYTGLEAITIVHRLGEVPVGEESILIAVSGRHRREVFEGGEQCLEEVKRRVEIWKCETFEGMGGNQEQGTGEWRSNEVDMGLVGRMREQDGQGGNG